MRITLVSASLTSRAQSAYNLATASLAAFAPDRVKKCDISPVEFLVSLDDLKFPKNAAERILFNDPEIVGFSVYCWSLDASLEIIRRIKSKNPEIKIVAGGPSVSSAPEEILSENPEIDVIVIGEGEETFAELLGSGFRNLRNIRGIAFREGENIIKTGYRPVISDLDTIPSPYLSGLLTPPSHDMLIENSRGCIYKCSYCAWQKPHSGMRFHGENRIMQEVSHAVSIECSGCYLFSSSLNFDMNRLSSLVKAIQSADPKNNLSFSFHVYLHRKHFHPEQVDLLRSIRLSEIETAIESVNPSALKTIGRPVIDKEEFASAIDHYSELLPMSVTMILGIPGDTYQGFMDTVNYLLSIAEGRGGKRRIRVVYVCWMNVTRGSMLHRNAEKLGLKLADKGIPYAVSSNSFSEKDLKKAIRLLYTHPQREIFRWVEANPWIYLDGLDDIDRNEWNSVFRKP
jgi:radical SAM superfamily enzyme YgiQ (UPF0313 family)